MKSDSIETEIKALINRQSLIIIDEMQQICTLCFVATNLWKKSRIWCTINKYFVCYTLFSFIHFFLLVFFLAGASLAKPQEHIAGITERMQTALCFLWIAVIFAAIFQDPLKQAKILLALLQAACARKCLKCSCPTLLLIHLFQKKSLCSRRAKIISKIYELMIKCVNNLITH